MKFSLKNITGTFKSKKFKYGGYATLITAVVITLLFVANLVVDMIPARLDLTRNQLYSLSEQTFAVLDRLDQDVMIYGVFEPGRSNPTVDEILRRYRDRSRRIGYDYIDPVRDPLTAQRYTQDGQSLRTGSIVVESGDKFRVISPFDLVNYAAAQQGQQPQMESLNVEQRVTSAILFVTGEHMPVVYTLEGHGQNPLPFDLQRQMQLENFEINSLNLLTSDGVPEDASLVIVNSPKRDLTTEEEEYLRTYLENEGRALFLMDILIDELPNFQALFQTYGIALQNAIVLEGTTERYAAGNPMWLVPIFPDHDIVNPIRTNRMRFIAPGAQGIEILEMRRRTLEIEPLMVTSDQAFGRPVQSTQLSFAKEEGDLDGPFNLALAITDNVYDMVSNTTQTSKLVVIGNSEFLNTGLEGSPDFMMNTLNWLVDREEGITIRPKSLRVQPLRINERQFRIYGGLTAILIPLLILAAGFVVWLRRRHL